ncbi:TPA: hypothetical protein P9G65_005135 [Pseudomonas aeruginosa]|nr:hypothetical protein [Pseudomonas aeruginosa]HDQ4722861.1 hypothetical protein [Pseudomonas aeruginosa]
MARIGLKTRLSKLEKQRRKQSPNRVLHYDPADLADGPISADLPVRVVGYWRKGENPASGPLHAFAGRFALVPDFGTAAAWEAAAEQQQRALLAMARSRSNEPAAEAPVSVGTIAEDIPAPKRKGEKGKRYVELPDGRTFDRETGEFEGGQ